jgi:hypothetical protein
MNTAAGRIDIWRANFISGHILLTPDYSRLSSPSTKAERQTKMDQLTNTIFKVIFKSVRIESETTFYNTKEMDL